MTLGTRPHQTATSTDVRAQAGMPPWLILLAFAGAVGALFGGYWDDSWHTERGRDSFFILPHVFIYAGVAIIGTGLGCWVLAKASRQGLRRTLANPTMRLAALSVAATLVSGPIDDIWHRAFGRDAVFWSPPHMLGIVGTLALGAALLTESVRRGPLWSAASGGLVLAAGNFIVAEYDTDVPQFDALWYLPALALASAVALGLVRKVNPRPWAATEAALAHIGFVLLVYAFLQTQDFPGPALPLLIVPALLLDLGWARGWPLAVRCAAFVTGLFAAYVPVRNLLGSGVQLDVVDVGVGVPLAFIAALPFLALAARAGRSPAGRGRQLAAATMLALFLLPVPAALAHDPGQGEDAGTARLAVAARDLDLRLTGTRHVEDCARIRSGRIVARRGGAERTAPLQVRGCSFTGRVTATERGRWFVYAELQERGRTVESWLPVDAGQGAKRAFAPARFAYIPPTRTSGPGELTGGVVLYGAMLGLLVAAFRLTGPRDSDAATAERPNLLEAL